MLLLESDKLPVDQLQFGYQRMASTTMCTWAVNATIEHYNNLGQTVYGCAADMSKAFDVLAWVPLFRELLERGVFLLRSGVGPQLLHVAQLRR